MGFDSYTYIIGFCLGFSTAVLINHNHNSTFPKQPDSKIQEGFVKTSRLEIKLEDRDNNGKKETILKYEGKPYLLREINGKPVIKSYDIKVSTK